jgi:branched-chain amino acid transport system ATP-binding protein
LIIVLEVQGLNVFYANLQVLWDVSLHIEQGEVVTLLGANGSGKSSLVQTIFGLNRSRTGSIRFLGTDISGRPAYDVVKLGLALVPEKRELFPKMTVLENLELGAYGREKDEADLDDIYALFPVLKEREQQLAGTLSGGEQQMLAIARSLMAKPKMLVLDEPSLGLSPLFVTTVLDTVTILNKKGLTILLVEQNVQHALEISHRGYILENGRITHEGSATDLLRDDFVRSAYLGL